MLEFARVASKLEQQNAEKALDVPDLLDTLDKGVARLGVMYEQYFLGIQKAAPTQLHTDTERKIRDLAQLQIRNTALRFRFNQMQSKFVSLNAYWRRTTKQIENGTHHRSLARVARKANEAGVDLPDEMLAKMPKFMREGVLRDRAALARKRGQPAEQPAEDFELPTGVMPIHYNDDDDEPSFVGESPAIRENLKTATGAHIIDGADAELDLEALMAAADREAEARASRTAMTAAAIKAAAAARQSQPPGTMPPARPSQQMAAVQPPPTPVGRASQQMAAVQPPPTPVGRASQQMAAVQPPPRPSQQLAAVAPPSELLPPSESGVSFRAASPTRAPLSSSPATPPPPPRPGTPPPLPARGDRRDRTASRDRRAPRAPSQPPAAATTAVPMTAAPADPLESAHDRCRRPRATRSARPAAWLRGRRNRR